MATKLKKMKLTSVDLVRAGANQKADICLFKSANAENSVENTEEIHTSRQTSTENSYNIDKANAYNNGKEGNTMLKIDKSRFTAEELEQYNALIEKAAVDPEAGEDEMEEEKPPMMPQKKKRPMPPRMRRYHDYEDDYEDDAYDMDDMDKGCRTRKSATVEDEDDDHEELFKSAFERQEARIAELEKSIAMKEFHEIAKKYAPLGENEDELAKTLYDMHQADEGLYDNYVESLNKSLSLVEKSGIFSEIGKSYRPEGSAVQKVESIAKSLMKADPTMTHEQAIAKAWVNNPELVAEYEEEYHA